MRRLTKLYDCNKAQNILGDCNRGKKNNFDDLKIGSIYMDCFNFPGKDKFRIKENENNDEQSKSKFFNCQLSADFKHHSNSLNFQEKNFFIANNKSL